MNNRTEQQQLLERYLDGTATSQEKQRIAHWYADFEQVELTYSKADKVRIENELRKGIYSQLHFNQPEQKKNIRLNHMLKIAASILLPLMIGFSIWFSLKTSKSPLAEPQWILLQTKAGERKKIILTDGSEIWLNAASRILYPKRFNAAERIVKLSEGEAFFKIFHNEKSPFRVIAPNQVYTRVLGTSFNVSAYSATNTISVTVISGKVAVGKNKTEMAKLIKGQEISVNTITSAVSYSDQSDSADAWTRGELIFNNHSLSDVVKLLGNAYGISITISKNVKGDLKCRGNFNLSQHPEEIVKVLCSLHGLSYSSTKDKIIIKPGKMK